jgi:translation elongation factor EF-Tu-like GTPase
LATKILKTQRKSILSENMVTENSENTPSVTQGSPNLIREGGRTVGSGRVATIIE